MLPAGKRPDGTPGSCHPAGAPDSPRRALCGPDGWRADRRSRRRPACGAPLGSRRLASRPPQPPPTCLRGTRRVMWATVEPIAVAAAPQVEKTLDRLRADGQLRVPVRLVGLDDDGRADPQRAAGVRVLWRRGVNPDDWFANALATLPELA